MQLIAYADRLGGDLHGLQSLLNVEFAGLFSRVHILPFFDPIDGADAGFDPVDHTRVDPRLGGWRDIAAIACERGLMADLIVNHLSTDSEQFRDVRKRGHASPHWPLFLKRSDVFANGDGADADLARVYRPRPGQPFTRIESDDGSVHDFWTTFSPGQLDINVETPEGRAYLRGILERFAKEGVGEIRLDAAGYAIKRRGTSCFMLPETYRFIAELSEQARALGMRTLVEIHSHFETQIDIASRVGRVYDFALPPLILHSLYTADAGALANWLRIAPRNCVTVLDTHDGIGIVDVGAHGDRPGLLDAAQIDALVEGIHKKTGGASRRASGHSASNLDIYQVNTTYYDALGRSDLDYLIARAIQFFSPGTPQVYYVGLLAGENDMALVDKTGVGRDINRHYYSRDEIRAQLQRPVVAKLCELIAWRNALPVFDGRFSVAGGDDGRLTLSWDADDTHARLHLDLRERRVIIDAAVAGETRRFVIDESALASTSTDLPRQETKP